MTNQQLLNNYIVENLDSAYRFAYSYTKNHTLAEDVVSESVVKALNSINTLKNPSYLKTWFYKIIINTAISQIRKNNKLVHVDIDLLENDKSSTIDTSNLSFNEIIEKLEPELKIILILRFFEDMTLDEISMTLDININTIKSRLYRALKILRIEMEEYS